MSCKNSCQPITFTSTAQFYAYMREYYSKLDALIASYIGKEQLSVACRKGCGICCHIKLDVNAHELLYLAHFIQNDLPAGMRNRVRADLKTSADAIAPLSTRDHFLGRFKCGFLQDNCCAVHPARPAGCRQFNSINYEGCRQIFSTDAVAPSRPVEDNGLRDVAAEMIRGVDKNFKIAGYDATVYEINQAMLMTLEQQELKSHWLVKEKILPARVEAKQFSPKILEALMKRQKMTH